MNRIIRTTLVAATGRDMRSVLAEICELVPGPVSGEVLSTTYQEMLDEAHDCFGRRLGSVDRRRGLKGAAEAAEAAEDHVTVGGRERLVGHDVGVGIADALRSAARTDSSIVSSRCVATAMVVSSCPDKRTDGRGRRQGPVSRRGGSA